MDVVCPGSERTALVGGVVSISHEVDNEPVPGLPYVSSMADALTVRLYVPSAAVSPPRPLMSYVLPETRLRVTALVIETALPLSVKASVLALKLLGLTGMLNVTATVETAVFRALGVTAAIELTDTGGRIWTVSCAVAGVAWTLPALSVAML